MTIERAREALREHWGYPGFRPGQEAAIEAVLSGRDTLTVMPTGGGKSLCYQVPALLLPGVTLVVSPLISLMKDQVGALRRAGVPAAAVNSTLPYAEQAENLEAAERGTVKLLYIAPERFESESFQARLGRLRVSLMAVDEAHCVSEWGHDFRPSYLRLGDARRAVGNPPLAALTATATPEVRKDIVQQLGLRDPATRVSGFDRRNLTLRVLAARNDSEKDRLLLKLLREANGPAIVYAATRKNVDALTSLLNGARLPAVGYHAGLGDGERRSVQEAFMGGQVPTVVATNAFGMGIDKPDVRLVVHYNMPGQLEAYYQEAGRAGRDGEESACVLLHAYADRFTHVFFAEQAYPPGEGIRELMGALRRAADASGRVARPLAELVRPIATLKGDRQAEAAVRVLADHGLVRQVSQGGTGSFRVRLISTPARITRELDEGDRPDELHLLRAVWRAAGGDALQRGAEVEWGAVAPGSGGRARATRLLETLQDEGFLEWSPFNDEGLWVLDAVTPLGKLPVDWRALDARRERQLAKLRDVERYAYETRCRRGYILRYFGDPEAMDACGACDRCLGLDGSPADAKRERKAEPRSRGGGGRRERGRRSEPEPLAGDAKAVFERLRGLRAKIAREDEVPAFVVFSDRTLREIARARPADAAALLDVPGVGPAKLEKYGDAFLREVQEPG